MTEPSIIFAYFKTSAMIVFQMFRCAGSWVTLSAFPPAEFVQSDLLKSTFSTLVSSVTVIVRGFINVYSRKGTGFHKQAKL